MKRGSICAHAVRLTDQRGTVKKDFSCQLNLRQHCSHIEVSLGGGRAFGEACLIDVGQSIQSTLITFDIHSMLSLMKHQQKLHLGPFGQTHRPKRQLRRRFKLPTALAPVLQPHSKLSRVGGRVFGEACLTDAGQSIHSTEPLIFITS